MTAFFAYPKSTAYGRVVAKAKIYEHAKASPALKDLFVAQIDQITWAHKLAPETVNLDATKSVTEIQVFQIRLKSPDCDDEILRAIDKAIPFPLIFEMYYGGRRKAVAAFKRPSEADRTKWVVSEYFRTEWEPEDATRTSLPITLNMGALYDRLIGALVPVPASNEGDTQARVDRAEAIKAKEREISRITSRLAREKQFKKRVTINAELRAAKQELNLLMVSCSNCKRGPK